MEWTQMVLPFVEERPDVARYRDVKGSYPDAVVLCRGDRVYVMFDEDAEWAGPKLELEVWRYNDRTEVVFGVADLDWVLPKLVRLGKRVMIDDLVNN